MCRQTCADIQGWTDVDGYTCETYVSAQWCSSDGSGGFGIGWNEAWGSFDTYANNGVASTDACCGCGGGVVVPPTAAPDCTDDPAAWVDVDGFDCVAWETNQWYVAIPGAGS